jgi:hypothetical protein
VNPGRLAAVLAVLALASPAAAQAPNASKGANAKKPWSAPRTPDGKPDLQGTWTNATITPLERAPGAKLELSEEDAALQERRARLGREADEQASDPNRAAPPVGGSVRKPSPGGTEPTYLDRLFALGGGAVGGYNSFWIHPGEGVVRIGGVPRSSILVDPPDGRVPQLTPEGRARMAAAAETRAKQGGEFDHPELRPMAERCLLSFGFALFGPALLPNYFYNNNYQIVQTPDHVMILVEMVHDARIIRIGPNAGQHPPKHIRSWLGDSIGRWEGDTLVVETTNFHPLQAFRGSSDDLKLIERFTRVDPETILYRFTIDDPATFTRPWSGELPFKATSERIYEYACHEGNYAMSNVLSGERAQEKKRAEAKK